jgi:DNA polymerase V
MARGGARIGAGKKAGSGIYGEPTKALRVPESMIDNVISYIKTKGHQIPLYSSKVQAGFPSPADDNIETKLDLNEYLVKHPAATFLLRATGESMIKAGIEEDDLLVVDRSIEAADGKIVIAAVEGSLTVKRLRHIKGKTYLVPENDKFFPLEINDENTVIWGVVTNIVKKCC